MFKKIRLTLIISLFMSSSGVIAMESFQDQMDPKEALIYKLLTLKAEHLGEDLHTEIEKIKDQVYATINEKDIRDFAEKYQSEENKSIGQEFFSNNYNVHYVNEDPEKWAEDKKGLKSIAVYNEIYFDDGKIIDSRDLLMASAYFPSEYWSGDSFGMSRQNIYPQFAYAHRYHHPYGIQALREVVERIEDHNGIRGIGSNFFPHLKINNGMVERDFGLELAEDESDLIQTQDFHYTTFMLNLYVKKLRWDISNFSAEPQEVFQYFKELEAKSKRS